MKNIEQLFKQSMGFKFDTPKKLNRSVKSIPCAIIEDLEDGKFTCESIENLAQEFPVFRYQTCITIHGAWDQIDRQRIGGYKNVIQNQNGSVEIRYSAIDVDKIKIIRNNIKKISDFDFRENSTERYFYINRVITKATFDSVRAEMQPIAERLTKSNIYGHVNLFVGSTIFQTFLCLHVHPLAIPENEILPFSLNLCGLDQHLWESKLSERRTIEAKEEQERLERNKVYVQEQKQLQQQRTEAIDKLKPLITHLKLSNDITKGILVCVNEINPLFNFYRMDSKGSFGRVNWSKATTKEYPTDLNELSWKEQKQKKLNEFRLNDCRLA